MFFLCDNLRAQKIFFEYKARPLMAQVRYAVLQLEPEKCENPFKYKTNLQCFTTSPVLVPSVVENNTLLSCKLEAYSVLNGINLWIHYHLYNNKLSSTPPRIPQYVVLGGFLASTPNHVFHNT